MDGGVAVQNQAPTEQGFFHMPKLQVPNYQKPRVFVPYMNQRPGQEDHSGDGDSRVRQNTGPIIPNATQLSNTVVEFDGKRIRKTMLRKTVDYNTSIVKYLENRVWQRDWRDSRAIQPDALYQFEVTPPNDMKKKPMNCLTTKFMRQSTNKFRCPIFCISWTPEGRRLVTGASSGEFTLWNGLTFSFETILQAHETSVRAMVWSHNDQWMLTADHAGFIKYWQTNMNNVKMYQGHKEPIRSISFCPTDTKFATCSDDGTVRVWDFLRCYEEKILRGHGADVKCVDWHPQKSLIASGSKDNQVPIKLWDPKSGQSLATLHAHKFTVMDIQWNQNGNWLLTAARDHLMKLFDIRNLKEELQVFKGHKKEATSVAWHPINVEMFASGGSDGAIMFWNAGTEKEVGAIEEAHEAIIWDLAWHPLGHVLASASNDHSTKFWTRNRPGDAMRDKYNLNILAYGPDGEVLDVDADVPLGDNKSLLPGMGLEHGLPPEPEKQEEESMEEDLPAIPGLDWSKDAEFFKEEKARHEEYRPRKKAPYQRPIPRSFEQAWITNQQPGNIVRDGESNKKRVKIQSLLTLDLPPPPPKRDRDDRSKSDDIQPLPPDHNPYLDGDDEDEDYRGDQDFRNDEDFRQDQDFRSDQDMRGDMDFRSSNRGAGNFNPRHGRPQGQDMMSSFQGTVGGSAQAQMGGPETNFRDNGPSGRNVRGPRRGFEGDDSFEDMEQDSYDQNFNSGPNNRPVRSLLGEGPPVTGKQGGPMNMEYNQTENFNRREHSPSPGSRSGGRGSHSGRGSKENFHGRKRDSNNRSRGSWEDEGSQDSYGENDSFNDSQGSGFSRSHGGRDNFRGGDRGGRGRRDGSKGNFRGGDRGGSRGGRGRGRGGR